MREKDGRPKPRKRRGGMVSRPLRTRAGRLGAERDLDGPIMNPMDAGAGNAFFPKKESARRWAARRWAARSGDSAPPSCAASADPRRAGGCRGRSLLRERGAGGLDGFMMDPTPAVKWQNAFFPKIPRCATRGRRGGDLTGGKSRMRKELWRPFPMCNTGRKGEAASTRATRGGAPMCLHDGSGAGPGAENALSFFPDAESAGARGPPFPRTGNSPCAPNAFAAPAEA